MLGTISSLSFNVDISLSLSLSFFARFLVAVSQNTLNWAGTLF